MSHIFRSERFTDNSSVCIKGANWIQNFPVWRVLTTENKNIGLESLLCAQAKEFELNDAYKQYWESAARLYERRKGTRALDMTTNIPKEYHIALICYTAGFSKQFNKTTRQVLLDKSIPGSSYPYRSFFHLLLNACEAVEGADLPPDQKYLFYGTNKNVAATVGGKIMIPQFLSTSTSEEQATAFMKDLPSSAPSTIFCLKGWQRGYMCTGLRKHSEFPYEEEVIMYPFQAFEIVSVEQVRANRTKIILNYCFENSTV